MPAGAVAKNMPQTFHGSNDPASHPKVIRQSSRPAAAFAGKALIVRPLPIGFGIGRISSFDDFR
jgi:hypothetical protein